ncbi:MAG: WD40 repeat domain-containing protein [Bacteroidota bacterium]
MSPSSQHVRYPGIWAFRPNQRKLFFGRDREARDLFRLVRVERLVVLFAKSGIGKSSLLNAGLTPLLEEANALPLPLRFQDVSTRPLDQIEALLAPYMGDRQLPCSTTASLWEKVKCCNFPDGATPVFIIDQFEEFFNHLPADREVFTQQLAALISKDPPEEVEDWLNALSEEERSGQLYWYKPTDIRIILSIRSDRLSALNEMSKDIPQILHNRFELRPLQQKAAKDAIIQPAIANDQAYTTAPFQYDPQTVRTILQQLSDEREEIESFQLQIVCQHLEQMVLKQQQMGKKNVVVLPNFLGGEEGINNIIKNYYDNRVDAIQEEDRRLAAQRLLEEGLIMDKRRVAIADAVVRNTYEIDEDLLQLLLESRLIRPENTRLGITYEISHDTLVEPILARYEKRRQEEERTLAEQRIKEEQARLEEERRKRRRAIMLAGLGFSLFFVAMIASFWAIQQRDAADRARNEALAEQHRADSLKDVAISKSDELVRKQDSLLSSQLALEKSNDSLFQTKERILLEKKAAVIAKKAEATQRKLSETRRLTILARQEIEEANTTNAILLLKEALANDQEPRDPIFYDLIVDLYYGLVNPWEGVFLKSVFNGHRDAILDIKADPNQNQFITASKDSTVRIWSLDNPNSAIVLPDEDIVLHIDLAPDGQTLLTGSKSGQAKLWNIDGQLLHTLPHDRAISAVAYSPDGQKILTASIDSKACIWNLQGEKQFCISCDQSIAAASFAKEEPYFLCASYSGDFKSSKLEVRRVLDGSLVHRQEVDAYVSNAVFSPIYNQEQKEWVEDQSVLAFKGTQLMRWTFDPYGFSPLVTNAGSDPFSEDIIRTAPNRYTALVGMDESATLITPSVLRGLEELSTDNQYERGLANNVYFTPPPNDNAFLTCGNDEKLYLKDFNGNLLAYLAKHKDEINAAAFMNQPRGILSASGNKFQISKENAVYFWEAPSTPFWEVQQNGVLNFISSNDEAHFITYARSGIKLWNRQGSYIDIDVDMKTYPRALFSPDNQQVATYSNSQNRSEVFFWDLKGQEVGRARHVEGIFYVNYSTNNQYVLTIGGNAASLVPMAYQNGEQFRSPQNDERRVLKHQKNLGYSGFSPNNRYLFTSCYDSMKIWSIEGDVQAQWALEASLQSVDFSNNQQELLITTDSRAEIRKRRGQLLAQFNHKDRVNKALYLPGTDKIITISEDQTAIIWRKNGQKWKTLPHSGAVRNVSLRPDAQAFLTYGKDNLVYVWNKEGKALFQIEHFSEVLSADYSPDGKYILTRSIEGGSKLWNHKGQALATLDMDGAAGIVRFSPKGNLMYYHPNGIALLPYPKELYDWLSQLPVYPFDEQERTFYFLD